MRGNIRISSQTPLQADSIEQDFAAYDQLDPCLRKQLQECNFNFSSVTLLTVSRHHGDELAQSVLYKMEQRDIDNLANDYWSRYRMYYPHQAAGATIQRYDHPKRKRRISYDQLCNNNR